MAAGEAFFRCIVPDGHIHEGVSEQLSPQDLPGGL